MNKIKFEIVQTFDYGFLLMFEISQIQFIVLSTFFFSTGVYFDWAASNRMCANANIYYRLEMKCPNARFIHFLLLSAMFIWIASHKSFLSNVFCRSIIWNLGFHSRVCRREFEYYRNICTHSEQTFYSNPTYVWEIWQFLQKLERVMSKNHAFSQNSIIVCCSTKRQIIILKFTICPARIKASKFK